MTVPRRPSGFHAPAAAIVRRALSVIALVVVALVSLTATAPRADAQAAPTTTLAGPTTTLVAPTSTLAGPTTTLAGAAGAAAGVAGTVSTIAPTTTTSGLPPITALTATPAQKPDASLSIDVGDPVKQPSQSVLIIVLLTLLSVAPALLILMTSFTRIAVVLSLTRNALGLQSIPPNQVIVGLALFLSLFVMRPTFEQMNKEALQPLMKGQITQAQAYKAAMKPMQTFMLKQTRSDELAMFVKASGEARPKTPKDVSLATLIPAFILSELKTAFIIGFVIFIPFLVIDLVVSSSLMSMGMMMLPPVLVSLPFKILLFVMVDGWALIVNALLKSFG